MLPLQLGPGNRNYLCEVPACRVPSTLLSTSLASWLNPLLHPDHHPLMQRGERSGGSSWSQGSVWMAGLGVIPGSGERSFVTTEATGGGEGKALLNHLPGNRSGKAGWNLPQTEGHQGHHSKAG